MLTSLAMLLALSLVTARATFEQNLREREVIVPGSIAAPRAAGPTTMLVLDLAMCLPAMLVLARRVIDPTWRLRLHASSMLFILLALLAAASSLWASDKFAAVIMSANFIAAAAILWAMIQLVRSWVHLRLVAAICFGLLLVYVAQGMMYRLIDVPDLVQYFEQHRDEVLQQRGYEPGSFAARQYEIKLRSGELFGFFASPNTFAAMIVTLGIVSAGIAVQRIVNQDEPGWAVAIIFGIIASLIILCFTYSKTAAITSVLAAGLVALSPWFAQLQRKAYFFGVGFVLLGTMLMVGHGIAHGSLVVRSLTFRWQYWIGAMHIFLQHPLAGVGWMSFGEYYLAARLPIAPEEIRDPHNFVVRAFVELGTIGGVLMLAWLARMWWEIAANPITLPKVEHIDPPTSRPSGFGPIFGISCLAIALSIAASVDFTLNEVGGTGYAVLELLKRLLFFALLLLGFAVILLKSSSEPRLDDRPAPWLLRAMAVSVAIFLIHNLIDFSLSEPGPMCVFAMLAGAVLGTREECEKAARFDSRIAATVTLVVVAFIWLAAAAGIVAPIAVAEQSAQQADNEIRAGRAAVGADGLSKAFENLWIPNSDYAFRAAVAMREAGEPIADAQSMLQRAIHADPIRPQNYRAIADFELRQPMPDSAKIISNYRTAIALDPNDLSLRRDLANALVQFGQNNDAIAEYEEMLRRNDLLPPDEPKRMAEAQVERIKAQIQSLKH